MKRLQNNYTTPAQSKRLLELGVPADSADCYIDEWRHVHFIPQETQHTLYSKLARRTIYTLTPCWSVGRLIDISRICTTLPEEEYMFPFWYDTQENVEWAIRVIESGVRTEHIDFSKLEDKI